MDRIILLTFAEPPAVVLWLCALVFLAGYTGGYIRGRDRGAWTP